MEMKVLPVPAMPCRNRFFPAWYALNVLRWFWVSGIMSSRLKLPKRLNSVAPLRSIFLFSCRDSLCCGFDMRLLCNYIIDPPSSNFALLLFVLAPKVIDFAFGVSLLDRTQ